MSSFLTTLLTSLNYRQRWLSVMGLLLVLSLITLFNCLTIPADMLGWTSGFTHPLHGGDHFLTMIAVGIWAAQLRGKAIWLLPVTFVSVMSLGGLAGAVGFFVPIAEPLILLSCLVFGIFVIRRIQFSHSINVSIVAFFAFFHGFAHGQEISTSASLISYTLGFMLATLLLHGAGILLVKLLVLLFALLLSHIAYAQASQQQVFTNTHSAIAQIDTHHVFIIENHAAPPNETLCCLNSTALKTISISQQQWLTSLRLAITQALPIANTWLNISLSSLPQLDIRFLTNGVGVTAPPQLLATGVSPCFAALIPAIIGIQFIQNCPYFFLILLFYIVTNRFLIGGVGATSPPVWSIFIVASFKKFSAPSCNLVFHINTIYTRCKSRAPPFACYNLYTGYSPF